MAESFLAELVIKGSIEIGSRLLAWRKGVVVRLPKFFLEPQRSDSYPANPLADQDGLEVFVENFWSSRIIISSFVFHTAKHSRFLHHRKTVNDYDPPFFLRERCAIGRGEYGRFRLNWEAVETCAQEGREFKIRENETSDVRELHFELAAYDEYAHKYYYSSPIHEFTLRSQASQSLGRF